MAEPESWHTRLEKELIDEHGGTWEKGYGPDGTHDGHPVEVRAAREDTRFRIGRDVHRELVRDDGHYIFSDDELGTEVVDADELSDIMGPGNWYADRNYPHRFVETDDVF